MRILQAPERIKEAPAQALRAVFAGVGQVLLVTERVRRRTVGTVLSGWVRQATRPAATAGPDTAGPDTAAGNGARPAALPSSVTRRRSSRTARTRPASRGHCRSGDGADHAAADDAGS